jgi:hypothetical protein
MPAANSAYKKVGGSMLFDSSLLSITFGSGGQERRGKCPPSYMPKTLSVILKRQTTKKATTKNDLPTPKNIIFVKWKKLVS